MPHSSPSPTRLTHLRATYVALAVGTIAAGLAVHWQGKLLSPVSRDVLGDLLWAAMIYWWIGALAPRSRPAWRGGAALAVCIAVELSQLCHTPTLDAFRRTRVGHLFLGSGFDPRDLLAYTLGVTVAVLSETAVATVRGQRDRIAGRR